MQKLLFALLGLGLLITGIHFVNQETATKPVEIDEQPVSDFATAMEVSQAITSIAGPHSKGQCAKYVRQAIQIANHEPQSPTGIAAAKDYGPWLEKHGYRATGKTYNQASVGDVAVLQNSPNHPYGHITIFCSDGHWRSDFVQHGFWIYRDGSRPSYKIYSL